MEGVINIQEWIQERWFELVQTIVLLTTLIITIITLSKNTKQAKSNMLLQITAAHRDIWSNIYKSNKLKRVFTQNPNLEEKPITEEESMFVNMVFLHMSSCVRSIKNGSFFKLNGIKEDLLDILSYPIPRQVWEQNKKYHDKIFVNFVEDTLKKR